MSAATELPRYISHKTVWALKIKAIDGQIITPEELGYAPFEVDPAYLTKHEPQVGGYYVVYADGYKSWSPAQAFEEGYTREGA
jgi:hypothetical protein